MRIGLFLMTVSLISLCNAMENPSIIKDKIITIKKGDKYTLKLKSNPSTGFSWQLAEPMITDIITISGPSYKALDAKLIGAGGEQKWIIKGLKPGTKQFTLEYKRPWENGKPADKRKITIFVE